MQIRKKFIILFVVTLLGFIALLTITFRIQLAVAFNRVYAEVAYRYPSDFNLKIWSFSVRNDVFREYLQSKQIPNELISFSNKNNFIQTATVVKNILQYTNNNNINLSLAGVSQNIFEESINTNIKTKRITDNNFPQEYTYKVKAKNKSKKYRIKSVSLITQNNQKNREAIRFLLKEENSNEQIEAKGSLNIDSYNKNLKNLAKNVLENIKSKDITKLNSLVIYNPIVEYNQQDSVDLKLKNIILQQNKNFEVDYFQKFVPVAKVNYKSEKCNYYIQLDIVYDYINNNFKIYSVNDLLLNLCNEKNKLINEGLLATCTICSFFPVDKTKAVQNDYKPKKITSLESMGFEGYVSSDIFNDLKDLVTDAINNGYNIFITSAYRSYSDQVEVFDYWVKRDMILYGTTQKEAIKRANTYSAIPGFSEHQLGTTVDINAFECNAFEGYCQPNEDLWKWLKQNARKYGFAQSYPENRESETGYIAEPWHYRWLGKKLTQEFYLQNKLTLNNWLKEKNGIL